MAAAQPRAPVAPNRLHSPAGRPQTDLGEKCGLDQAKLMQLFCLEQRRHGAVVGKLDSPDGPIMNNNSESDIPHGFGGLVSFVSVLSEPSAVPEHTIVPIRPVPPSAREIPPPSTGADAVERSSVRSFGIVSATIVAFAVAFFATSIFLWRQSMTVPQNRPGQAVVMSSQTAASQQAGKLQKK